MAEGREDCPTFSPVVACIELSLLYSLAAALSIQTYTFLCGENTSNNFPALCTLACLIVKYLVCSLLFCMKYK